MNRPTQSSAILVLTFLASCSGGVATWPSEGEMTQPGTSSGLAGSSGQTSRGVDAALPSPGPVDPGTDGVRTDAGTATSPPSAGDGFSCAVKAIVHDHCSACHGSPPTFGAPMSLASAADFRATSKLSAQSEGQLALMRTADDTRPMPPPPNARLTAAESATLGDWINAGMPDQTCTTAAPDAGKSDAGSDAAARPPLPADVTCYTITARASAKNDKYSVPTTPDLYQCFNYTPPWGSKKVQVVSTRPIIDNARVIHHWILYNSSSALSDGTNAGCSGAHPNAAFIAGWAPGGDGLDLPPDVGLRTEAGGFTLEVHYNNTAGAGQLDASGAEVCVTEKMRTNEAAVHWLGTQNLNKMAASGTCVPNNKGPVTVLSSSPHMHLQGRHLKTVINRKGGAAETLIDVPFDFNTQISYPTRAIINVGDTLTTTCSYAKPTPFGPGTNQEMCYNFVVAYPAGELAQSLQLFRKYDCTGQ